VKNRFFRNMLALKGGIPALLAPFVLALPLLLPAKVAKAQTAGEMKPLATITLSSYDELKEDIDFIGSLAGKQQMAAQMEQMIMMFTQNKGLAGLETSKPLGVIVQTDGMNFSGAICVPVSSLDELLEVLQPLGVNANDFGNGMKQLTANNQTLFAKEQNGWAFLSMMPQMLENLPENPDEHFAALADEYDLGVRAHVQNVPEPYKQMFVQQLQAGMEAGTRKLPDETDEQFQTRKEMTAAQVEQVKRAINEIDEFTFGLSVDSEQQRTFLDVVYTAVPDTTLAQQIAENSDPKTNFAGFFQPDAAAMMTVASKVTESDIAQAEQMFEVLRKQMYKAIDEEADLPSDEAREAVKSACGDFLDAFSSTMRAGTMDGGAVLNLSPTSMTLVAGGFVGEPQKVEAGLRKLAETAQDEPDFSGVNWNADSHADVAFHTMSYPVPNEKESRQLLGETLEVAVGIGKESVFFAAGRDCLQAVKKVIDDSAANPGKSVPPMEMTISLKQIIDTAAAVQQEDNLSLQMVADALKNEAAGRDHFRIVVQPIPNGARTRIEAEEGVLRAIGIGVMAAQMEAMGAGTGKN